MKPSIRFAMGQPSNTSVTVDFHQGTLRLHGVARRFADLLSPQVPLVHDPREDCFRCDALHFAKLSKALDRTLSGAWSTMIEDACPLAIADHRSVELRGDQRDAVAAFMGNQHGVIVMPTGTGKTVVAIELILQLRQSTLIVVPVRDLMYQWHNKLREATGIDAGLIGDGVHRVSPISITTYDSAAIHMPRIGDRFHFLIFDEVHHLSGPWRSDAARMSIAPVRLGLTATPPSDPQQASQLDELVGPVVYFQSIATSKGKTLADYDVCRLTVELTPQEDAVYRNYAETVRSFMRDRMDDDPSFRWEDSHRIVGNPTDNLAVVAEARQAISAFRSMRKIEEQADGKFRLLEDLFRLHAGEPVLVFAGSNVMARRISLRFLVPCLLSHCRKRERQELLSGFAEGRYPVLVANRVLDEGVDLPQVKTAIVVGGLGSQRQAIQRLGRVLRRDDRDRRAVLYEVVTNGTREVQRSRNRRRNAAYRQRLGQGS